MRLHKARLLKRFAALLFFSLSRLAALQQQAGPEPLSQTGILQGRVLDETGAAVTAAPVMVKSDLVSRTAETPILKELIRFQRWLPVSLH